MVTFPFMKRYWDTIPFNMADRMGEIGVDVNPGKDVMKIFNKLSQNWIENGERKTKATFQDLLFMKSVLVQYIETRVSEDGSEHDIWIGPVSRYGAPVFPGKMGYFVRKIMYLVENEMTAFPYNASVTATCCVDRCVTPSHIDII